MDKDYDKIRKWIKNIPDLHGGAFRRTLLWALQKKGRSAAVKAMCQNCTNWQTSEIANCEQITCPLWRYRPTSKKGSRDQQVGKIAARIEQEMQKGDRDAA